MSLTVALDIGGTFTDLVAFDSATHRFWEAKSATTPAKLVDGIVQCLVKADLDATLIDDFVHGSTIAINTALERSGALTALVVTRGMRDIYSIGRQNRPDAYDIYFHRPQPLVPRSRTIELDERLGREGVVLVPCTDEAIAAVIERVRDAKVESIAVCLLHSFANSSHEEKVASALKGAFPEAYVSASHEIVREYREYERISTTVLNAYVGPKVSAYLSDLEAALDERGFGGRIFIMQSNGGVMSPEIARITPVAMMESGPVGGIAAAAHLARQLDLPNLIAFDMGGTTAKASLVADFEPTVTHGYYIGGYASGQPLQLPVVDVVEVGTGGGSIAEVDEVGALKVGPRSAGGFPGPISYGWGGTSPTVTDANLVLGRLSPDRFLGGEMPLDLGAARDAIDRDIAVPCGLDVFDAALGIVDLAMASMALAVRAVSVERGHDPRDFTMLAFGGAGPLHACGIARELNIPRVVIPLLPGHFSAFGMVSSSFRHDFVRTVYQDLAQVDWARVLEAVDELDIDGRARLEVEGAVAADIRVEIGLDLRYVGQEFAVNTPVERSMLLDADKGPIAEAFARLHHQRYGHSAPTEAVELVNVRLVAKAARPEPALEAPEGRGAVVTGRREVRYRRGEAPVDVPIYWRDDLSRVDELVGPAIVEEYASTTVLWPGDRLRLLPAGELMVDIDAEADSAR